MEEFQTLERLRKYQQRRDNAPEWFDIPHRTRTVAEIVKRIEQILKEKGITQRELASRIGCNETQIVRWTHGFPNYTLSTLAKLSVALGGPDMHEPGYPLDIISQELRHRFS